MNNNGKWALMTFVFALDAVAAGVAAYAIYYSILGKTSPGEAWVRARVNRKRMNRAIAKMLAAEAAKRKEND